MLVRKLEPFPVECVVRGYRRRLRLEGVPGERNARRRVAPRDWSESSRLDPPIFSPGHQGGDRARREHHLLADDGGIGGDEAASSSATAPRAVRARARAIAARAASSSPTPSSSSVAMPTGEIRVMDEVLTPDSSRFWPSGVRPGRGQPSLDKQPLRDYLETLVERGSGTGSHRAPTFRTRDSARRRERYQDVFLRLTGVGLDDVPLQRGVGHDRRRERRLRRRGGGASERLHARQPLPRRLGHRRRLARAVRDRRLADRLGRRHGHAGRAHRPLHQHRERFRRAARLARRRHQLRSSRPRSSSTSSTSPMGPGTGPSSSSTSRPPSSGWLASTWSRRG
jgi:phosphoribosylaminoimidazole-succinocarboxamide synthase